LLDRCQSLRHAIVRLPAAYAAARENGEGAINFRGVMIDIASVRGVQELVALADMIEARR
jgi:citrate lyase beta subunit